MSQWSLTSVYDRGLVRPVQWYFIKNKKHSLWIRQRSLIAGSTNDSPLTLPLCILHKASFGPPQGPPKSDLTWCQSPALGKVKSLLSGCDIAPQGWLADTKSPAELCKDWYHELLTLVWIYICIYSTTYCIFKQTIYQRFVCFYEGVKVVNSYIL